MIGPPAEIALAFIKPKRMKRGPCADVHEHFGQFGRIEPIQVLGDQPPCELIADSPIAVSHFGLACRQSRFAPGALGHAPLSQQRLHSTITGRRRLRFISFFPDGKMPTRSWQLAHSWL
jgi:hypothetical protein